MRKGHYNSQSARCRVAPNAVISMAVNRERTARYNTFRIVNYPDDTIYPMEAKDLKRSWAQTEHGAAPETIEDSLVFHLLYAILVGHLDDHQKLHPMEFEKYSYRESGHLTCFSCI